MGWDAPWHWVILAIVVIALFGYKKMPDAARSLGRSLRIFKTEIKGMSEDDRVRSENKAVTGAPPAVESVAAPAPPAPVPTEPAAGSEAPAPTEPSVSAVPPADAELPATAKNDTPSA
ncbi:MAG: sec-independent protein translocase protein TatA [Pseudonocardiales bacterium]|jgi:sec-independent protein translocase protein TatA|nr:sec-independent protein translocase protein TatA [Pseudonocardiales bacterium]